MKRSRYHKNPRRIQKRNIEEHHVTKALSVELDVKTHPLNLSNDVKYCEYINQNKFRKTQTFPRRTTDFRKITITVVLPQICRIIAEFFAYTKNVTVTLMRPESGTVV